MQERIETIEPDTPLVKTTREWVEKNYDNAKHLVRAAWWVRQLEPNASEAVVLAALTHDMERAFSGKDVVRFETGYTPEEYMQLTRLHSERSARIVGIFLKTHGADEKLADEVEDLIREHEFGGTNEQNVVQAADSLSFLEVNVPIFISWIGQGKRMKKEVEDKFRWMYERIQLPEAKELARPLYEKAMKQLGQAA